MTCTGCKTVALPRGYSKTTGLCWFCANPRDHDFIFGSPKGQPLDPETAAA